MTQILLTDNPSAILTAANILHRGGLVAFPTDTVYGVGAHGFQPAAIERLFQVKGRAHTKAIPLLIADEAQMHQVARMIPTRATTLIRQFWPGALTLVVWKSDLVPNELTGGGPTVAVRLPDHPVTRALIRAAGVPLATTSANRSGHPDSITAADVEHELGDTVDLILDGGTCPGGIPSTVVDLTVEPVVVLRVGPISEREIQAALEREGKEHESLG